MDGSSIAFDNEQLPDSLRMDLNFNSSNEDPLGMILSKTSEFYLSVNDRIQPNTLIHKGQLFGTSRAIDGNKIPIPASSVRNFNLNAGARSLFMLASICNKSHHYKLKE